MSNRIDPWVAFDWSKLATVLKVDEIACIVSPRRRERELHVRLGRHTASGALADEVLEEARSPITAVIDLLSELAKEVGARVERQHPMYGRQELSIAALLYGRLVKDAEKRGDVAGADAWRIVVNAIETAEKVADTSRANQTWDMNWEGP